LRREPGGVAGLTHAVESTAHMINRRSTLGCPFPLAPATLAMAWAAGRRCRHLPLRRSGRHRVLTDRAVRQFWTMECLPDGLQAAAQMLQQHVAGRGSPEERDRAIDLLEELLAGNELTPEHLAIARM